MQHSELLSRSNAFRGNERAAYTKKQVYAYRAFKNKSNKSKPSYKIQVQRAQKQRLYKVGTTSEHEAPSYWNCSPYSLLKPSGFYTYHQV